MNNFRTTIIRSYRKTIALHVKNPDEVIVKAPLFMPDFFIKRFINKNLDWIKEKTNLLSQQQDIKKISYREGGNILYLGNEYNIIFVDNTEIRLKEDKILLPFVAKFRLEKELDIWFVKQARDIITKQVEYYADLMKARYTDLKFSDTKSQWGRCTHDNKLQFSWRLIMGPLLVINYVVVHELAHTFHKNHSRAFWNKVRLHNPSYRQQIKWLKENGHSLKD